MSLSTTSSTGSYTGSYTGSSTGVASSETSPKEIVEGLLRAFMAKNLEAALAYFADDGVFIDPHYPQMRMVGRAAIRQGIEWGLASLEKPGFTVRKIWADGDSGVIETDTHHLIRGGMEAKFDQVFVFETRNGKLTRLQSYVPYGPHGIAGAITHTTRLIWRVQGKFK